MTWGKFQVISTVSVLSFLYIVVIEAGDGRVMITENAKVSGELIELSVEIAYSLK